MFTFGLAIAAVPPPQCSHATSVSINVKWSAPPSTDLHEIQVAPLNGAPFLSQTSTSSALSVDDLAPATAYSLTLRSRDAQSRVWTGLSTPVSCATKPLLPLQAHVLPPTTAPLPDAVYARLAPATAAYKVQHRKTGAKDWSAAQSFAANGTSITSVKLEGLTQDTAYEVRASVGAGPYSDSVVHRTASSSFDPLVVHRISENCGDECEPDLLYNHDTGSILADVEFITAMSRGGHFVQDFNASVTTRYCVHHERRPAYADYVSCNGNDTEHYDCYCNNWIDRCIGRLDTSVCNASVPDPEKMPACACSDASLAESAKFLGRMPVYNPFPHHHHTSGAPPLPDCNVPPLGESTFLGYWYSLPAAAECAARGRTGCSWERRSWQHFVRGWQLLAKGFNTSEAMDMPQLKANAAVIEKVIAEHAPRCCMC